ncbi:hypothetical protein VTK26DRAFT_938 [Humicola hyalothermophila]
MPPQDKKIPALDFRALPKIELHAHLSGSISRQCLHEVWLMKKEAGETDLQDPLVVMPPGKHDYDLKTFFPLFSSYIYNLVNDAAALRYTTLSVLRDFAADGVVYLELRTTPRPMPAAGITAADYVRTILDTIAEYELSQAAAPEPKLHTNLILSIDRRDSPDRALATLSLARQFSSSYPHPTTTTTSSSSSSTSPSDLRTPRVVGLDLCGDPSVPLAPHLSDLFRSLRRCPPHPARPGHLGLTLHFAEAACSASDAELDELLGWRPDRLGHVICVGERVKREIIRRGRLAGEKEEGGGEGERKRIGLELCLSCNVHAGMVSGGFEGHHFGEWWNVPETVVVLSTDDVGVFGSPLSNEYALVAQHFGLDRAEICALARRGIDVIFGGEGEKERLRNILWTE